MNMLRTVRAYRCLVAAGVLTAQLAAAPVATGAADPVSGAVTLPIEQYRALIEAARREARPAAVDHAVGIASVAVAVRALGDALTARVTAALQIEVHEDEWTEIPLLPLATALAAASADGQPISLAATAGGMSWSTSRAGTHRLELSYDVDVRRSEGGNVLPLPLPAGAGASLRIELPGRYAAIGIVPGASLRTEVEGERTIVTAAVPPTPAILISWQAPAAAGFAIGQARYRGELRNDTLELEASFDVELFRGDAFALPLLSTEVTLAELRVDGESATVLTRDGRFAVMLSGAGRHRVDARFQVSVQADGGPPSVRIPVPRVPVSSFSLDLPGRKELTATPRAHVDAAFADERTRAELLVPLTDLVVLSWVDAVPENVRERVRATATVFHLVEADEGLVQGRAVVVYEVSRGRVGQLELEVPRSVQINRITSPSGGITDWSELASAPEGTAGEAPRGLKTIAVYLDREVDGTYELEVQFERLLGEAASPGSPGPSFVVPLVRAADVQRQRGMVALLASRELTLEPVTERGLSRVGESQIPAAVRNLTTALVTHTYKYGSTAPALEVRAAPPEKRQGKLDAEVDTLVSVGEVTLKGSASIAIFVKSGAVSTLALVLPPEVTLLGLTGPSIRTHTLRKVEPGSPQRIDVEFTQEIEGAFRLEVAYERLTGDAGTALDVPTVSVEGAEVERGRIAVEALSAVEVQAAVTERLTSLDLAELPRQLVLKTTNPILLAYRYAHSEPPFRLALTVSRHPELAVQQAAIEEARYETLITTEGLAVTRARFTVRNARRQFLRLELPPRAEIWSAFTDGKPIKPARPAGEDGGNGAVLLGMVNSTAGFEVEVIYARQGSRLGSIGILAATLPTPDILVTRTRWDLYLPSGLHYLEPRTTLEPVSSRGAPVGVAPLIAERGQSMPPLRIAIPTEGIHFAFEKLYANRSAQPPTFSVRYASAASGRAGGLLGILGALLAVAGAVALAKRSGPRGPERRRAIGALGLGLAALAAALGPLAADPLVLGVAAAAACSLGLAWLAWRWRLEHRARARGGA